MATYHIDPLSGAFVAAFKSRWYHGWLPSCGLRERFIVRTHQCCHGTNCAVQSISSNRPGIIAEKLPAARHMNEFEKEVVP